MELEQLTGESFPDAAALAAAGRRRTAIRKARQRTHALFARTIHQWTTNGIKQHSLTQPDSMRQHSGYVFLRKMIYTAFIFPENISTKQYINKIKVEEFSLCCLLRYNFYGGCFQ